MSSQHTSNSSVPYIEQHLNAGFLSPTSTQGDRFGFEDENHNRNRTHTATNRNEDRPPSDDDMLEEFLHDLEEETPAIQSSQRSQNVRNGSRRSIGGAKRPSSSNSRDSNSSKSSSSSKNGNMSDLPRVIGPSKKESSKLSSLDTGTSFDSEPPLIMSPNEELELLAVKGKRNSPDRDDDGRFFPTKSSEQPMSHQDNHKISLSSSLGRSTEKSTGSNPPSVPMNNDEILPLERKASGPEYYFDENDELRKPQRVGRVKSGPEVMDEHNERTMHPLALLANQRDSTTTPKIANISESSRIGSSGPMMMEDQDTHKKPSIRKDMEDFIDKGLCVSTPSSKNKSQTLSPTKESEKSSRPQPSNRPGAMWVKPIEDTNTFKSDVSRGKEAAMGVESPAVKLGAMGARGKQEEQEPPNSAIRKAAVNRARPPTDRNSASSQASSSARDRRSRKAASSLPGAVQVDAQRENTKFDNLNQNRRSQGSRTSNMSQTSVRREDQSTTSDNAVSSGIQQNGSNQESASLEAFSWSSIISEGDSRNSAPSRATTTTSATTVQASTLPRRRRHDEDPELGSMPSMGVESVDTTSTVSAANGNTRQLSQSMPTSSQSLRPGITHALSAELVTEETNNPELEKERLRRQAEEDAEAILRAATISAEAKLLQADEPTNWRPFICLCCCLSIIAGIVVTVVLVTREPAEVNKYNSVCQHAYQVLPGDNIAGVIDSRGGTEEVSCEVEFGETGFGLWYSVIGTGSRLSASTCIDPDPKDGSDTQVMIFEGSCNNLLCVGGSDNLCGVHGQVGFMADEGVPYYILVKGFRASFTGPFNLTIDELETNDKCDDAENIKVDGGSIFGSTRDYSFGSDEIGVCATSEAVAPAAWFRVEGDGNVGCASVVGEQTNSPFYPLQLSLFSGDDCGSRFCAGSVVSNKEISWNSKAGESYYLAVHGTDEDTAGDFFLDTRIAPQNGICETAEAIDIGAKAVQGTLEGACKTEPVECFGVSNDSPGVWYAVEGTGNPLTASATGFDCDGKSQITVYSGAGCSSLDCIADSISSCERQPGQINTKWFSSIGETYYIFVQSAEEADFKFDVLEHVIGSNGFCNDALDIDPTGEIFLDSIANSTAVFRQGCSETMSSGVFYRVQGTGENLAASSCFPQTNFSTDIVVFSGDCENFGCADTTIVSCDGSRSVAFWPTIAGETYYIFVQDAVTSDATNGQLAISVDQRELSIPNDFCGTAEELTVPTIVTASTIDATIDDVGDCTIENETFQSDAPGIWYSLIGSGVSVTASLCEGTDYDTKLFVFKGSCGALQCIQANDDGCSSQSQATWDAEAGEKYYILVSGFGGATGSFQLQLFDTI